MLWPCEAIGKRLHRSNGYRRASRFEELSGHTELVTKNPCLQIRVEPIYMRRRRRINIDQLIKDYVVSRVVPAPSRLQLFEQPVCHALSSDVCGRISELTDKGANRHIRVGLDFVIVQTCE